VAAFTKGPVVVCTKDPAGAFTKVREAACTKAREAACTKGPEAARIKVLAAACISGLRSRTAITARGVPALRAYLAKHGVQKTAWDSSLRLVSSEALDRLSAPG